MKNLSALTLLFVFTVAAIYAKDKAKESPAQCRSLAETNYLIGQDEALLDGKVCKRVSSGTALNADASRSIPKEHGLYYQAANGVVAVEGQAVSFARTGSALSSAVTFGIKSAKVNVQILGESSAHVTPVAPVFYYRVAEAADTAGGSAGDLVLVRLSVNGKRRQFEVSAHGAWRASQGISIRSQLPVTRKRTEPDLYRLTPSGELQHGEYAFYMFRGYDLPGFIYDFTVE